MNDLPDLYKYLCELRDIVKAHPEFELISKEHPRYFSDETSEFSRDMICADLNGEQMAHHYQHYLDKFPGDTKEHALAVYNAVDYLADECLITSDGDCHWDNHKTLGHLGFRVRAGETDSFGWLTGVICCDEFLFVYG
jgi:hypothetical protein